MAPDSGSFPDRAPKVPCGLKRLSSRARPHGHYFKRLKGSKKAGRKSLLASSSALFLA